MAALSIISDSCMAQTMHSRKHLSRWFRHACMHSRRTIEIMRVPIICIAPMQSVQVISTVVVLVVLAAYRFMTVPAARGLVESVFAARLASQSAQCPGNVSTM